MNYLFLLVILLSFALPVTAQDSDCIMTTRLYANIQAFTPERPLDLYADPSLDSQVVGELPGGEIAAVLEGGPVCDQGMTWVRVDYNGQIGWVVEQSGGFYNLIPYVEFDFVDYSPYADNITFHFNSRIAESVTAHYVPGGVDAQGVSMPEYTDIVFQRFNSASSMWEDVGGTIRAYPISAFEAADPAFNAELEQLRSLLSERPESPAPADLPTLPDAGGSLEAVEGVEYLDFQTGSGVRFLDGGVYTFQGLTADDSYYIAARFPLDMLNGDASGFDALIESLNVTSPIVETDGAVEFEGISFTVDPSLASRVEITQTEPYYETEPGMTMFGSTPGYTQFDFFGFPVEGIQYPRMVVMPVDTFEEGSRSAEMLGQLQTLLDERPDLSSREWLQLSYDEFLPMLPLINAAQVFAVAPEYIDFENGSGVRYVTYYAQDVSPIVREYAFYTFQGITDDGRYVVSAFFPIAADVLPSNEEIDYSTIDWDSFVPAYTDYLADVYAQLENSAEDGFTPALDSLDGVIESLRVE